MTRSREEIIAGLPTEVNLLTRIEVLKNLKRQNPLADGDRREYVAEHSWHIALGVILLADYCPYDIDIAHTVLLATVHDVVEAFVGDTFAFGSEVQGQQEREEGAILAIKERFPADATERLAQYWREYEDQQTPEAKFVKGVDAFLPILLNFLNPENSSWRQHGVEAAKVQKRLRRVDQSLGELAGLNEEMILRAVAEGILS
jgi:putative hydrolase of HD superfamily